MPRLKLIMALGRVAHLAACEALGFAPKHTPFSHGAFHESGDGRLLVDSYHCSPQNVATGRLSTEMLERLLAEVKGRLD